MQQVDFISANKKGSKLLVCDPHRDFQPHVTENPTPISLGKD